MGRQAATRSGSWQAAHDGDLVEGQVLDSTSAFQILATRMLDQDAPHQLRRNGEKMSAIVPLHSLVIHQPYVGFIHEGCGLQAVAVAFASHVTARQAPEFVIDNGRELVEGTLVSIAPGAKQSAGVANVWLAGLDRIVHRLMGWNYTLSDRVDRDVREQARA